MHLALGVHSTEGFEAEDDGAIGLEHLDLGDAPLAMSADELINAEELQNSNFDFSGIDQFWKIVRILEQNQEPDARDWAALFQTPGYRELIWREWPFEEEFFKKNFRIAFKPSFFPRF